MNKIFYPILIITICWSCSYSSKTEKYQDKHDRIVDVHNNVKEIKIEDVLIGSTARLFLIDDYLIIGDYKSLDKLIHIFSKTGFNYITSIAPKGKGPGEIANMGHIGIDEVNRIFYVSDHGKQKIFSYDLDSVLLNPAYMPKVKMEMNRGLFPNAYQYINDTLCIGQIIEPIGNSNYSESVAKWNMVTGKIKSMKYKHPDIKKKRVNIAVSVEHGIYVECYINNDLMTICSLNGDLKYNVYGQNWDNRTANKIHHYGNVVFCNDRILASYSGGDNLSDDYYPTKFLVFNINGDYLQTLEIGYLISHFCYDQKNNRIIMNLNEEMQFAYLELDGLISNE